VRYAVNIPPFTDPATLVQLAIDAEASGWDGVFVWDHLVWATRNAPDVHDPWVLLGAIAQATERVRLGTLVTPLSRRRVHVVAKQLLTLDHLSSGRVTLGVGLGEPPVADFSAFGDESDAKIRAAILDEGLGVLDQLLRGAAVDHDGEHLTAHGQLRPGPIQQPRPPIWVAGVVPNRRPLRRARRWDGVVPIGPQELLTPDMLAGYLGGDAPPGWDVVATRKEGVPAEEYADAGATWLVESTWPLDDWVDDFRSRIRRGPGDGAGVTSQ
jgi:alkanesulfonate monooxygenase SsuD/methylene tetrahydromethanopterin reductase-like flavin-dependent oxidoreductase (luciferase family)